MRLAVLFLFLFFKSEAQDLGCGTVPTPEQIEYMDNLQFSTARIQPLAFSSVNIPVQIFIIRRSNGTGSITSSRANALINEVNAEYGRANMTFVQIADPIFVDNDEFYDLDSSQENNLAASRDKNGVINIYINGGSLTSGGTPLCGYTRFPPSADRVFVAAACADNEFGTTAHELGHYFTLYHTHGKTNTGTTDELVDGSNCSSAGDDVCDTPADPNLSGQVSGCSYTGSATDANGQPFDPDVGNLMSYAPNSCRSFFSNGQFDRVRNLGLDGRSYLNFIYTNFTAQIDVSARTGCSPTTITFEDITPNSVQREWTFEGGSITTSSRKNITVTYSTPGKYDVSLYVLGSGGQESTITRTNFITIRDPYENLSQSSSIVGVESTEVPSQWSINNRDRLQTYQVAEGVSKLPDGNSILLDNYNYNSLVVPTIDDLRLTSFDLTDIRSFDVIIDYAYSYRFIDSFGGGEAYYDTLKIGYSTDCSEDVESVFELGGDELMTIDEPLEEYFIPTSSDWSTIHFTLNKKDILNYDESQTVTPVIQNYCGNGNNLYIDQIQLVPNFELDSVEFFRAFKTSNAIELRWSNPSINSRSVVIERRVDDSVFQPIDTVDFGINVFKDTDVDQRSVYAYRAYNINTETFSSYSIVANVDLTVTGIEDADISIYPNPVKDKLIVSIDKRTSFQYEILDIAGRRKQIGLLGINSNEIDFSDFGSGIYILSIVTDGISIKKRFIKL